MRWILVFWLTLSSIESNADVCNSTKYEFNKATIWIFNIEERDVEFNLRRRSESILEDYDFRINCSTHKYTDNKTGYLLDAKEDGIPENLIDAACTNARQLIANKPIECLTAAKTGLGPQNNKSEKLINAKRSCSELGFKPKTEKFGNCVLELTK